MRSTVAAIFASLSVCAQNIPQENLFRRPHGRSQILPHKMIERKTQHFKFTATVKPGSKFVQNSTVNLTGFNYEVRAKLYVNRKVSFMVKTKNRTRQSQDVASFGIIFKL